MGRLTDQEIADRVGCDRSTVAHYRREHGIPSTRGRPIGQTVANDIVGAARALGECELHRLLDHLAAGLDFEGTEARRLWRLDMRSQVAKLADRGRLHRVATGRYLAPLTPAEEADPTFRALADKFATAASRPG